MDPSAFRLQKISEIQKLLELEIKEHTGLSKMYNRGVKIARIVVGVAVASTMLVGGVVGITFFCTVVEAPIVVIVETIALGTAGLFSTIGSQAVKIMSVKADKHEQILLLAKAKLNTISYHISVALSDNAISAEEYSLMTSEYDKFMQMKEEIRIRFKNKRTKMKL